VICAVPRSPTPSPARFFVDGSNSPGNTTSGTLFVNNFNGTFQSSQSFSSSAATYDISLSLNPITTFSYVSVLVSLPPNGGGVYFGTTAVQP
jgi:hypothetical protein